MTKSVVSCCIPVELFGLHQDVLHSTRQGYYIQASSAEEAWEKMAIRFPEETSVGFTVQDWEGFNVVVVEKRDS